MATTTKNTIKILSESLVNRIAAGEVLERPSSAIKELVENSIDAKATYIKIEIEAGGKNLICITDNGVGMTKDEMQLALKRHATSKITGEDLLNLNFFGFRGEALPSIASVSRMQIDSKTQAEEIGHSIHIEGGDITSIQPSNISQGTKIQVRDLFFATPARLKFLKTDKGETLAISDIIKKIAMANPHIGFEYINNGRKTMQFAASQKPEFMPALKERLQAILGDEFITNSLELEGSKENTQVQGFIGLPTYNRNASDWQFLFVNNRPVKDKVLFTALRVGYKDFIGGGRHPVAVIFVKTDNQNVDVNVHPAKAEVRFKHEAEVRSLVINAIREGITNGGHKASTTVANYALSKMQPNTSYKNSYGQGNYSANNYAKEANQNFINPATGSNPISSGGFANIVQEAANQIGQQQEQQHSFSEDLQNIFTQEQSSTLEENNFPLGLAKAQLHKTYIIAQTNDSIVIVDQHAAHERLVYEQMKKDYAANPKTQKLLIPEIIALDETRLERITPILEDLDKLGFKISPFGKNELSVEEIPAILSKESIKKLVEDIADDLTEHDEALSFDAVLEDILETSACHNSIRAGRSLTKPEMDAMLRQMEATPHSGQCNHGRPTYVELKLADIERLFGRR